MVVDISGGLQERIADGAAEECEPSFFHVLTDVVRNRRSHRDLGNRCRMVDDGFLIGKEGEEVRGETAEFLLDGKKQGCVFDGGFDLQLIPDDTRIIQQSRNIHLLKTSHDLWVEVGKSFSVVFPSP